MASWHETPKELKPNIFDWDNPSGYRPPRVEHDYIKYRQGSIPEQSRSQLDSLKNKWVVIGAAGAVALALTAVGFGKQTLGEGFRAIFPDDSPPKTHPVKEIIDNHG